jgi:glycosyltransferase involved in cell wall biosynthesis
LLEGLAGQRFRHLPVPDLSIVIADNECSEDAEALCERFAEDSGLRMRYLREPQRGISHARNACLAAIPDGCDFFAMIDDDEIPYADWIEELLLAQQRTAADVVQGRVLPELPDGAPGWIARGGYFDWQLNSDEARAAQQQGYADLRRARTNNVLVRHAVVREMGLWFDPRLALTGGEDIAFFEAIHAAGYRIVYAPLACVRDIIPPERTTLDYLWRTWYRVGCNERWKGFHLGKPNASRWRLLSRRWKRTGTHAFLLGLALLVGNLLRGRASLDHLGEGILLIARGLGRAAGLLGIRYEQYR